MSILDDLGPWYIPSQAAPMLGRPAREVQQMCAERRIDHQRIESPGGRVRYKISEQAIRRYLNATVVKAKRGAA